MQTSKYLEKITANFNRHSTKTVVVLNTLFGTAVSRADEEAKKNRYLCVKQLLMCLSVLLKASSVCIMRLCSQHSKFSKPVTHKLSIKV